MRAVFAALMLVSPAAAQDLNDYDLILEQNADKVVIETAPDGSVTRTLDTGNGVSVSCAADGCVGMDMSGWAMGCAFGLFAEVAAFAQVCAVPLSKDQAAVVDGAFRDVGAFVAANAVPPRPADYPTAVLAERVRVMQAEIAAAPGDICAKPFETETGTLLGAIVHELNPDELRRVLSVPRLPVMNPCL